MEGKPPIPPDAARPAPEAEGSDPPGGGQGGHGLLPDGVKKALLTGMGALFTTEEGARRVAREWKLPKDVIGFIGQQAQGAKDDVLRVLSEEIRRFLESDGARRELARAFASLVVEVHAEVRFRSAEEGARPEVKATVRTRRKRPKGRR